MQLARHAIERRDFPAGRKGYDPEAVHFHLRQVADAVEELREQSSRSDSARLAGAAADQVRAIVEAAERSAADITARAEHDAQATRGEAGAAAVAQLRLVEEAKERLLERADTVEAEANRLLESLRTSADQLVDSVRAGAGAVEDELEAMRATLAQAHAGIAAEEGEGRESSVAGRQEDPGPPVESPGAAASSVEAAEPEPEPELAPEPAPALEAEAQAPPREEPEDGDGVEAARLVALNMALNGTPRAETGRYLADNFELSDPDSLLDEVYERAGSS